MNSGVVGLMFFGVMFFSEREEMINFLILCLSVCMGWIFRQVEIMRKVFGDVVCC